MSEINDNSDPRLERMLRRWGAEEAADRAPIGAALRRAAEAAAQAAPQRPRRTALRWVIGLGAMAAAAAAVFVIVTLLSQLSDARGDAQTAGKRADGLASELADARQKVQDARSASVDTERELQQQIAPLIKEANAARRELAVAQERLTEAEGARDRTAADLTKAVAQAGELRKQIDAEAARATRSAADANTAAARLAAATAEIDRARKASDDASAATRKVQAELDDLKAKHAVAWNDFRQAYLAAASPGEQGLAATQSAVKRSRLIERCGKVRQVVDAAQRPLLEKLEVVLTRLEMLDPGPFVSEQLFQNLLVTSGILKQLDEALENRTVPPQARGIYFEARLVLSGGERAS